MVLAPWRFEVGGGRAFRTDPGTECGFKSGGVPTLTPPLGAPVAAKEERADRSRCRVYREGFPGHDSRQWSQWVAGVKAGYSSGFKQM